MRKKLSFLTITAEIQDWIICKDGLVRGKIFADTRELYPDGTNVCIMIKYQSEYPKYHIIKSFFNTAFVLYKDKRRK